MDPVSQLKVYRGAIIALSGAIVVLILLIMFGLNIDKAAIVAFFAWIVPVGVNAARQFYAGQVLETPDKP